MSKIIEQNEFGLYFEEIMGMAGRDWPILPLEEARALARKGIVI